MIGNLDGIKQLLARLASLKTQSVYVGVPAQNKETVKDEPQFNLASLAAVLEFGSADKRIPSRPFLRQTLAENHDKYVKFFSSQFQDGMAVEEIYTQLAVMAKRDVQGNIRNGNWVANAPSTIKRKGSSKPLIDTGRLMQSIKGVVR